MSHGLARVRNESHFEKHLVETSCVVAIVVLFPIHIDRSDHMRLWVCHYHFFAVQFRIGENLSVILKVLFRDAHILILCFVVEVVGVVKNAA